MKKKTMSNTARKLRKDWVKDKEGRFTKNGKVPIKYLASSPRTGGARHNIVDK